MLLLLFLGWWNQWHHRVISTVHFYSYHFVATPYNYPPLPPRTVIAGTVWKNCYWYKVRALPGRVGSSDSCIESDRVSGWVGFGLFFLRMRGSLLSRRTEQRLRQLAISTVGSVKIKLLLFLCIAFTLFALLSRGSGFTGWTSPSGPPDLLPFPRFVK